MTTSFRFDPVELPPEAKELRQEVRAFLRQEEEAGTFSPHRGKGGVLARVQPQDRRQGWIGMTWPKKYGGHERSQLERYVVTEEMLAAHAPTRAHSTADRQSGPVILRYGQEEIRQKILPQIAAGELCFCIGLSEPNSGSDVFAASTRATKTDGGWLVNGRKIWTSNAHEADYMIALLRTSPSTKENRRHGLTQFLVEMNTPGITIRPIINLTGGHDFNEVVFDDAFLPDSHLIGEVDMAWKQATDELAYERSGPDRWIETFSCLVELVRVAGEEPSEHLAEGIGRQVAHLATLQADVVVGRRHAAGRQDAGGRIRGGQGSRHQFRAGLARQGAPAGAAAGDAQPDTNDDRFEEALRYTTLIAPKLTIQGGTREVLRGIIARGLGLR